jgi:hypothetical protein
VFALPEAEPVLVPLSFTKDAGFDCGWLSEQIATWNLKVIVTEKVFRPNKLVGETGEIRGASRSLGVPVLPVAVASWRSSELGSASANKEDAVKKVKVLYPNLLLRRTSKSRVDWEDGAEAVLIGRHGIGRLMREKNLLNTISQGLAVRVGRGTVPGCQEDR